MHATRSKRPSLEGRGTSQTLTDTASTALGRAILPRASAYPDRSGIHALPDSHDAFAARVLLARAAERSLDLQYYIWRSDLTGTILFAELQAAAARGVRIRLLLDDNNTSGLDPILTALDANPNIEVRLFNPFMNRRLRQLGYLTDFFRLNRRMHNKSFTADNLATIVGGRNIGDAYFGATDGVLFADLDVLAVGPVVNAFSQDFDRYWNSGSSYPADRLLPPVTPAQLDELAETAARIQTAPAARAYVATVRQSPLVSSLLRGELALEWAPTMMISDSPAKGLGLAGPEAMLASKLQSAMGGAIRELDIVSPYFVPTRSGVDALTALTTQGVAVRVLTNALESTDVALVHAGYARRRKALLQAGIQLYELRRDRNAPRSRSGSRLLGGSSASSLHAKTFVSDRSRVFVGSFNFDPRSANLNTELGFVIDSNTLARSIGGTFDTVIPLSSYEVQLSRAGKLIWLERREGGESTTFHREPGTGIWKRAWIGLMSRLPVEWLL